MTCSTYMCESSLRFTAFLIQSLPISIDKEYLNLPLHISLYIPIFFLDIIDTENHTELQPHSLMMLRFVQISIR